MRAPLPFLVHPSGLEPEPKASEAFMVSNSTTGAYLRAVLRRARALILFRIVPCK